jgi:hypothetical protein
MENPDAETRILHRLARTAFFGFAGSEMGCGVEVTASCGNARSGLRPRIRAPHARAATPRCRSRYLTPSRRIPGCEPSLLPQSGNSPASILASQEVELARPHPRHVRNATRDRGFESTCSIADRSTDLSGSWTVVEEPFSSEKGFDAANHLIQVCFARSRMSALSSAIKMRAAILLLSSPGTRPSVAPAGSVPS